MLNVEMPLDHFEERRYIIDVILGGFLGMKYTLMPKSDVSSTVIFFESNKSLEINDAFFKENYNSGKNYLDLKNIPFQIIYYDLEEAPEKNIIGLYGTPEIIFSNNKIYCGIDIFASAFFMLTRWEEYVVKKLDKHGRFPAQESIAYKNGFLSRPIVNEYVEVIWKWFEKLGVNQTRKQKKFQFINTHDIDRINLFESSKDYIAKPVKALLTERTLASFTHHTKLSIQALLGNDPYDVYDYFMDSSEKCNIKSHFFFMATGNKTKFDNGYDIYNEAIRKIIKNVIARGHIVGIHPSYGTLNNPGLLSTEINQLRDVSGSEIVCGRQHYLRFDLPNTWQHWEDNKMQWDSSLAYSEKEGFRCGVCYSFPVFNIITKQTLNLIEKPLIIMDGTLVGAQKQSVQSTREIIDNYINKVKKYSGEFVFLWHNSSFEYLAWKDYKQVYDDTLASLGNCHRS